jgi:hypothetical protein
MVQIETHGIIWVTSVSMHSAFPVHEIGLMAKPAGQRCVKTDGTQPVGEIARCATKSVAATLHYRCQKLHVMENKIITAMSLK